MTTIAEQSSALAVCRVCLENRSEMCSVFSEIDGGPIIATVITESTAVQVQEDDGLSESICSDCVEEVKFVAGFIEKTRQSDRILKEMCKMEVEEEDDKQLYALEISRIDPATEFITKVEMVEDEDFGSEDYEETDEPKSPIAVKDDEESDRMDEDDSDYEPDDRSTGQAKAELSFVDANDVPISDSDEEIKPKRKKRTTSDVKLPTPSLEELDEVETETFTVIEVGDNVVCCTCFKLFDSEEDLVSHGKTVHKAKRSPNPRKSFACKRCFRRYSSKGALQAHVKQASAITRVFDCQLCPAMIVSPQKRQQHAHNHPPVVQRSLTIGTSGSDQPLESGKICCAQGCNEMFETDDQLVEHSAVAHVANKVQSELTPNDRRPIQCQICYRRFIDERGLRAHQLRPYTPKKHVCTFCGLKFVTAGECKRHEVDHLDVEKTFQCDQCDKAFVHRDQLKAHRKRHAATREFMCNICGQSYLQRHNLQAHMLKHEGKLPFECDICKKAFRVKAKMIYHQRVHSGERPFPCRYCDQAFADSTNRLRHEMSHTGIKPYKCDYCEKTFITKRLKREHEKTHANNARRSRQVVRVKYDTTIELE